MEIPILKLNILKGFVTEFILFGLISVSKLQYINSP